MRRRHFLRFATTSLPLALLDGTGASPLFAELLTQSTSSLLSNDGSEIAADVAVIGGGLGGCAAALAAARNGARVVLTEETDWLGGQLTSQAVPPDEHPWIESFGAPRSYQQLRRMIRQYYRDHYPLTAAARADAHLNPGGGSVSKLCHEPRVALAAIYQMLAPLISSGQVRILLRYAPTAVDVVGDSLQAVTCRPVAGGDEVTIEAGQFIDATEQGDLLPLSGAEYVTGFESQRETGEPHAPAEAQPENMQACTWCFPMDYVADRTATIEKPSRYDFWKEYVPDLKPPWPGQLFDWTYSHPVTLEPRTLAFDPAKEASGWWLYRRILDRSKFDSPVYANAGSVSLVNWPQNDYLLGNLYETSPEQAAEHREGARQLSLALLYWMQTEAPRPDGGVGWPGLGLRPDLVDTDDGLAKAPYVRESRRIRGLFQVVEQHVSTNYRMEETGLPKEEVAAATFPDSVGVGSYRIDLHPSTGGDNYIDLSSLPFEIPLGALIPVRLENLIAGCKNLAVTHITNGCYRLHPVEWNIGEAAGALAAYCVEKKRLPREVREESKTLENFQRRIQQQGVETRWPKLRPR